LWPRSGRRSRGRGPPQVRDHRHHLERDVTAGTTAAIGDQRGSPPPSPPGRAGGAGAELGEISEGDLEGGSRSRRSRSTRAVRAGC
jgi:hypothetical protein